jgi:putative Holliday junction resolvase
MQTTLTSIMALDVGERRIGVALAGSVAKLAQPLTTLEHTESIFQTIVELAAEHNASELVIGLPRGLDGQETAQTIATRKFAAELERVVNVLLYLQDEALTSRQAEAELKVRGQSHTKADVDALAATYILEDYLKENNGASHV